MKFSDYITDRIVSVVCFVISEGLVFGLLWLVEVPMVFIIFTEIIFLLFFLASLIWDYHRRSGYYNRLLQLLDRLDEKTLLMEIAERPGFLDAKIVSYILKQNNKYQNDKIAEMQKQSRDYRDFLDTWVHEIKTPITSARLIIENEKNPTTLKIEDELRKIDNFVELVLYYARSSDVEKDFKVENTTLKALVSTALKTYSKPIIQAGGRIHMEGMDIPVCADSKSCSFIIGQVISNAIKYRQEEFCLEFRSQVQKNRIALLIHDNGIGISKADLSRVFDKGFTGENGRRFSKSTGIGLYLCKMLCDRMNIAISISSEKGQGTTVALYFPTESLLKGAGV
ncbi:sensor histidine kinase [Mediterraneibacter glycyrrhizinilyticus]|nr:sensor histidine kinase [Mediterraneibacter glycyrrhizinilyticus]MBM6803784.1 sensor histidine kinase [Mediterraneibacter glycyrrhizinilyticus]